MIAGGLLCAFISAAFLWFDWAQQRLPEERRGWVEGQASLYEVGIRRLNAQAGAGYAMTARYVLRVGGRDYEGSAIERGFTCDSAAEVRALIGSFAPEAAEYSFEDLGPLNPQRSWSVAYRIVPARYDQLNPAHSEILLVKTLTVNSVRSWLWRGGAALFALAAFLLLVLARPVARGRSSNARREA